METAPHAPRGLLSRPVAGDRGMRRGATGLTGLTGEIRTLDDRPLAGVTLRIKDRIAQTDGTGHFHLSSIPPGHSELLIDGVTASTLQTVYGVFEIGIDLKPGIMSTLPFTIWMPEIDIANAVPIPSPTDRHVVVTSPRLPGLELRLPPGTTVRDREGQPVTQISLTPIPVDRPPFPLPFGVQFPMYFTVQPGGARIEPYGARFIYPNLTHERPGARVNFWNYDPGRSEWYIYGRGTVSLDGTQVVPDASVAVYTLGGASINPFDDGPSPGGGRGGFGNGPDPSDGDPVDLGTGLFLVRHTDLFVPDVLPIGLIRTYRPAKLLQGVAPFGIGTSHLYEMFLLLDAQFQETDLILPEGGRVHYTRISPGIESDDAVFEHTATPSVFFKSQIRRAERGWDLTLKDGTVYTFMAVLPPLLQSVADRCGNRITIERQGGEHGKVIRVISPNGRWLELTLDEDRHVTRAKDHTGRVVSYGYDEKKRLTKITDPAGFETEYTYDPRNLLLTIRDARGIVYLKNEYPPSPSQALPVLEQTFADGSTYRFAYSTDPDGIGVTEITDSRGHARRVTFNADRYILTDSRAVGTPEEQTTTYERQPGTNLVTAVIDPLGRRTAFEHNAFGDVERIIRLAGTPEAATTELTYEPEFNELATVTDPLGRVHRFGYDESGNLTTVTDPLDNVTTLKYNAAGQPISITDPLDKVIGLTYELGLLSAVTDPLGATTKRYLDSAGRPVLLTDPLGRVTECTYDAHNRLTKVIDPLGGVTGFDYDANGNLLQVTDARGNSTTYTYDKMDRCASRTDPLKRTEIYEYDELGNMTKLTDRKKQVTTFTYDPLNRLTKVEYPDDSTTTFVYDAGNRLRQTVDSLAGTITLDYDDFDLLTEVSTPQGTIRYTYDRVGRRKSMTVEGQEPVTYDYDDADRLTEIAQGATVLTIAYDDAGRPITLTLPSDVVVEYGYDAASNVTSIAYKRADSVLGDLTYDYDPAGNRIRMGGSFARTAIPDAISSLVYDKANRLTQRDTTELKYDENGNLTSDGARTYSWDARDRLASVSGAGIEASFGYDALNRRIRRTVNSITTEFLHDGFNVVQERTGGVVVAAVLGGLGIDEHFLRSDVDGARILLFDALGSTLGLLGADGVLKTEYTYEPFGETAITGTASTNAFQFTGRENDGTGLYYHRARYYSPTLRRFISEDPIDFAGRDINLYAYAFDNPVNFTDRAGLQVDAILDCLSRIAEDEQRDVDTSGRKDERVREAAERLVRETLGLVVCVSGLAGVGAGGGGSRKGKGGVTGFVGAIIDFFKRGEGPPPPRPLPRPPVIPPGRNPGGKGLNRMRTGPRILRVPPKDGPYR